MTTTSKGLEEARTASPTSQSRLIRYVSRVRELGLLVVLLLIVVIVVFFPRGILGWVREHRVEGA